LKEAKMNYLLEIVSQPEFALKFCKNNPEVDNDLDLGKFVKPESVNGTLCYEDAKNGNIPFDALIKNDALTSVSGGVLFSTRVKELIEENFPHEIQAFPTIINYRGEHAKSYFAINIYNKIECYDLSKSIYEKSPVDHSYEFEKIVPIEGPLEEYNTTYNIVRCIYDNRIVVSEQFRQLLEENNINSFAYEKEFIMEW
jgi:hypothetical protein